MAASQPSAQRPAQLSDERLARGHTRSPAHGQSPACSPAGSSAEPTGERPGQTFSRADWLFRATGAVPAPALLLVSIVSIQIGNALAKTLLAAGVAAVTLMRTGFAAVALWLTVRPRIRSYSARQLRYAALLGLVTAAMNLAFYAAVERVPLGVVMAIDFLGPITVAVAASRRAAELAWPFAAYGGVLLLTPVAGLGSLGLNLLGLGFACCAATGWGAYVVLTARTSAMFDSTAGLTLATTVGAVAVLPFGLAAGRVLLDGGLLLKGFAVAMLATAIPFAIEFAVLRRMAKRLFGVLLSVEPAVAALVGWVTLGQALGLREWLAIALVSGAAVGAMANRREVPRKAASGQRRAIATLRHRTQPGNATRRAGDG